MVNLNEKGYIYFEDVELNAAKGRKKQHIF